MYDKIQAIYKKIPTKNSTRITGKKWKYCTKGEKIYFFVDIYPIM